MTITKFYSKKTVDICLLNKHLLWIQIKSKNIFSFSKNIDNKKKTKQRSCSKYKLLKNNIKDIYFKKLKTIHTLVKFVYI